MTDRDPAELEDRIRTEVERAVAPYAAVAPPVVLAKMRELVERYWRENPEAARVLRIEAQERRVRSGVEAIDGGEADAAKEA
jgi:hypothetical protein